MQITLKLYASLGELLPEHASRNQALIAITKDTTINQLIDHYRVPHELAHLVLLNGVFIAPEQRDQASLLKEGDVLAIWPPVAGG